MKRRRHSYPQGEFNTTIQSLSHEGRGISDVEGKKLFLQGGLPGEEVTFRYTFSSSKRAEGVVVGVDKAHPHRVKPLCEAYERCGGCSLQHFEPNQALAFKQETVLDQFRLFAKVLPETLLEPLQGPLWGYRKKARLGVKWVPQKNSVLIGFREKVSNKICLMDACEVLDPKVGVLIGPLRTLVESLTIKDQIAQIEVSIGEGIYGLIIRHLVPIPNSDLVQMSAFCKEYDLTLYGQSKGPDTVVKLYPETGDFFLTYSIPDYNLSLNFHPLDFTQVNPDMNQKMIRAAVEALDLNSDDELLDLFCGIGNFTLPLATIAKKVVGVEGSTGAIDRALHNAQRNGIENCEFHVADLFQAPGDALWAKKSYSKIVLDPPRTGALEVLPLIAAMNPEKLLYISCNPATLARDTGILVNEFGFKVVSLRVMDMFPHTSHVECMALFVK